MIFSIVESSCRRRVLVRSEQSHGPALPVGPAYKEGLAMNAVSSVAPVFVGADVSKHRLDVHLPGRSLLSIANDARGVRRVVDHLASSAIGLVAVEATGGYERLLVRSLLDAGLPVARVNPLRVRRYAQGRGVLAKTDSIDAQVLADFARDNADRLHPLPPISDTAVMLQELTSRRRQLVCQVTANKNQREHCGGLALHTSPRRRCGSPSPAPSATCRPRSTRSRNRSRSSSTTTRR